jgi:hypothetical protein
MKFLIAPLKIWSWPAPALHHRLFSFFFLCVKKTDALSHSTLKHSFSSADIGLCALQKGNELYDSPSSDRDLKVSSI